MAAWGIPKGWRNSFKKMPLQAAIQAPFLGASAALLRRHWRHHWECILGLQPAPFSSTIPAPFRHHTSPVQAPLAAPLKVHFLVLQPVHFQAPYQPRSGTTCSTIESPFFGAATSPFKALYQCHFRRLFASARGALWECRSGAIRSGWKSPVRTYLLVMLVAGRHPWGSLCLWCRWLHG